MGEPDLFSDERVTAFCAPWHPASAGVGMIALRSSRVSLGDESCTPEQVVELKRNCGAQVSYTFLKKCLEWFEIVQPGEFAKVQFQKLEESIYGPPIYKQAWFKRHRALKQNS